MSHDIISQAHPLVICALHCFFKLSSASTVFWINKKFFCLLVPGCCCLCLKKFLLCVTQVFATVSVTSSTAGGLFVEEDAYVEKKQKAQRHPGNNANTNSNRGMQIREPIALRDRHMRHRYTICQTQVKQACAMHTVVTQECKHAHSRCHRVVTTFSGCS